jgi:hypothetical protein
MESAEENKHASNDKRYHAKWAFYMISCKLQLRRQLIMLSKAHDRYVLKRQQMTDATDNTLFHEVQLLRQLWLWLVILIPVVISWYTFIVQIVLGQPAGNNPAPDFVVWVIWLIFGIGFVLLLYTTKLVTDVRQDSICVSLFPFYSRTIPLSDVVGYEVREYRPLWEYGGWGIRFAPWKKRAYTMSGNRGVELTLSTGMHFLIGSQRSDELADVIGYAMRSVGR